MHIQKPGKNKKLTDLILTHTFRTYTVLQSTKGLTNFTSCSDAKFCILIGQMVLINLAQQHFLLTFISRSVAEVYLLIGHNSS